MKAAGSKHQSEAVHLTLAVGAFGYFGITGFDTFAAVTAGATAYFVLDSEPSFG